MRTAIVALGLSLILLTACGGDDDDDDGDGASVQENTPTSTAEVATTDDLDRCALLTDEEVTAVLGSVPEGVETGPSGPFKGCSWDTGDLSVNVAPSDRVILAPGEDECPSADIGEESYACSGRIKFLSNGYHVSISTLSPFVTNEQLLFAARAVLPKLQD